VIIRARFIKFPPSSKVAESSGVLPDSAFLFARNDFCREVLFPTLPGVSPSALPRLYSDARFAGLGIELLKLALSQGLTLKRKEASRHARDYIDDLSTGQKMSRNLLYDIKRLEQTASLSDQNGDVELWS
jgi:hypothetical protein